MKVRSLTIGPFSILCSIYLHNINDGFHVPQVEKFQRKNESKFFTNQNKKKKIVSLPKGMIYYYHNEYLMITLAEVALNLIISEKLAMKDFFLS